MLYEKRGMGGYFLTAYGIAVKHGFVGTEEEWLESLIGKEIREITVNDEGTMHIHYSKGPDDDVPIEILETLIGNVAEHEENAQAWATGYRGTEPVDEDEDDPAYHNNGPYYRDEARDYALDAAESARHLTIDDTLTYEGQAADAAAVRSALLYVPVEISSFSITTPSDGKAELGSTVTAVTLSYTLNQVPDTLVLDDETPVADPGDSGEIELTGQSISANKTWTLAATDAGSPIHEAASATKTAALTFLNRVYWGADTIHASVNSTFVKGLGNNTLTNTTARTITGLNSTSGNYIWYAVPHRINSHGCKFKVSPSDFFAEFVLTNNVSVANDSGYTENYDVYRSPNPNMGSNVSVQIANLT